ncbi:hypothetical protein TNCV_4325011 [Trichonephila clavipes]|nr:hypothetical protein TNCV_4325011 [Trichonephila clavipes]
MWPVLLYSISPVGSTVSLSEHVQLHSAGKMSNQHQVSCEIKKLVTKTFQKLTENYGDETLFGAHVFEWYKRFSGGRICVEDDEHAGYTRSAITDQNIAKIPVKSYLKGTHFTSVEKVQAKTENLLTGFPKPSFQNCYQQCQHRTQKCVNAEGNYFKGDTVTEN